MTSAQLAQLLIEGPRVVREDAMAPLSRTNTTSISRGVSQSDPITRTAQGANHRSVDQDDGAEGGNDKPQVDKKISVYLNRAALRLFSVPSFQTYWKDTVLIADPDAQDGRCRIQFVFHRLPEEAYPLLTRLLAAPRNPTYTRFVDKGQARTGVELEVAPDDFGGEDYDYAF